MSETEWTNEAVVTMVQEYEKRPELWKKQHNLYRVQTAKSMAWRAVARVLDCDIGDARKKFNSIMASYRRERTKVKEGGRSGWFLYPYMAFLPGYMKSPDDELLEYMHQEEVVDEQYEQIESLDQSYNIDSDGTEVSEPNLDEIPVIIKNEPTVQAFTTNSYSIMNTNNHSKKKLTRTLKRKPKRVISNKTNDLYNSKLYVDNRIQEVQTMMNKDNSKKDDCDTYGEYIASTLRKHNNKTQCLIKQAINNILFEQEMQKYENTLDHDIDPE